MRRIHESNVQQEDMISRVSEEEYDSDEVRERQEERLQEQEVLHVVQGLVVIRDSKNTANLSLDT
jgi:hypothetical protein